MSEKQPGMGENLGQEKPSEKSEGMVSPDERSVIERMKKLEILDDAEANHAKVGIILVWKGLRPASIIDLKKFDKIEENEENQIKAVENFFDNLKICYKKNIEERDGIRYDEKKRGIETKFYRVSYYLSHQKEDLDYIDYNLQGEQSVSVERKLGKIFGYPQTAIDVWVQARNPDEYDKILPRDYTREPYSLDNMAFEKFRLSKSNWKEEFKVVEKWANEIKRLDPDLYEEIVLNYRSFVRDRIYPGNSH